VTPTGDELSTRNAGLPQSPVAGCEHPPDPGMVTGMYEVSVTTSTIAVGPIRCGEVGEVIEVLREGVITALAPGRRVMWVVRCPAGRVVRGDVTINAATANRPAAVADHLAYVRSVLLDGHEASTDSASLTEGV